MVVLIVHNLRSAHNVGSLLRSADGLGVSLVYLTGYTPYPWHDQDARLPHIAKRVDRQIHKTALGAEGFVNWRYNQDIDKLVDELRGQGFAIAALEQAGGSTALNSYRPPAKLVLIIGNEVNGVEPNLLKKCDVILEIPMRGRKESFNVAAAASMALYHLTYLDKKAS